MRIPHQNNIIYLKIPNLTRCANMEIQTEIFKDLFQIAVKNYLKKCLIASHKKTSIFAWNFVEKYPRTFHFADSDKDINDFVADFLIKLDQKLSDIYENNTQTSDLL